MSPRQRTTFLILCALGLLFVLAAGLTGLELKPGRTFNIEQSAPPGGLGPVAGGSDIWVLFVRGLMTLILILLPVYVIYMLLDPQRRKRLLADLIGFAFLILLMTLLQNYLANLKEEPREVLATQVPMDFSAGENGLSSGESLDYQAEPNDWAAGLTSALIGMGAVGAAGLAWWALFRRRKPEAEILVQVAAEAEETLESILSGKNLRETILLCYRRMEEVAVKNRGIPRDTSATPHEFQETLVKKGLPAHSVHDLTRLFEDVRYGDFRVDEESRGRAVLALRTIIAACRKQEEAQP